jgi:hypothetical protein
MWFRMTGSGIYWYELSSYDFILSWSLQGTLQPRSPSVRKSEHYGVFSRNKCNTKIEHISLLTEVFNHRAPLPSRRRSSWSSVIKISDRFCKITAHGFWGLNVRPWNLMTVTLTIQTENRDPVLWNRLDGVTRYPTAQSKSELSV